MLPSSRRVAVLAPFVLSLVGAAGVRADTSSQKAPGFDHLTVFLERTPEREAAFEAFRTALTTPGAPEFHHWLTPAQVGERFGAGEVQIAATAGWLRAQGFEVIATSASRSFIEIKGPQLAAERAFGVRFTEGSMIADRAATVPPGLGIRHVGGLVEQPHPLFHRRQVVGGSRVVAPADFTAIYNLGPVYANNIDGTGVAIAVIGRSNVYPPDLVNFGARAGITMPVPRVIVAPTGGSETCTMPTCNNDQDDQGEAQLDVERAGSVAPGAELDLVISHGQGDTLDASIEYAIDHYKNGVDAPIITISFGACERDAAQFTTQESTLFHQAEAQGQTIFVSSGDSAAEGCDRGRANAAPVKSINYLCGSPSATCVGGTMFNEGGVPSTYWDADGNAMGYIPEGAWNEPGFAGHFELGGSGGGTSTIYPRPAWQQGLLADIGDHRMVPDVSFTSAAGHDPYLDCSAAEGADCTTANRVTAVGGTSAAAPSMAGIMALIIQSEGEPQGNINPVLYGMAKADSTGVFHDTTPASSGVGAACDLATPSMCNNSCPAPNALMGGLQGFALETGYDEATGLGSVDVAKLVDAWVPNPSVYIDPSFVKLDAGQSSTSQIEAHGFGPAATVAYTCGTGLPSNLTCTTSGSTVTIAVAADAASGAKTRVGLGLGAIALAGVFGLFGGAARRRRLRWLAVLLVAAHCSGGGSGDDGMMQPTTTSTNVVITGTAGGHSATANLGVEAPTAPDAN